MKAIRLICAALCVALAPAALGAQGTQSSDTSRVDVSGKWAFAIESPFSGTPSVTFVQKGDSITGRYVSNALGTRDFAGTVKARRIEFSFSAESGGQNFVMAFAGKVDDADSISGSIDFSGMATGSFTAKRVKP